jgi:hypothetical protein
MRKKTTDQQRSQQTQRLRTNFLKQESQVFSSQVFSSHLQLRWQDSIAPNETQFQAEETDWDADELASTTPG